MIIITGGTEDKIMFLLRRTLFFIVIPLSTNQKDIGRVGCVFYGRGGEIPLKIYSSLHLKETTTRVHLISVPTATAT